jgi:hypothetical protein
LLEEMDDMSDWMNDLNEMQRYYALRREAEQHRLVYQALEGRQRRPKIYCRVICWFGHCLSAIGKSLQEHYGNEASAMRWIVDTRKQE